MRIFIEPPTRSWGKTVILMLLAITLMGPAAAGTAQAKKNKRPVKTARAVVPEKPIYAGYPLSFSGRGHIDRIGDGEIVIDDGLFKVNSAVSFNKPNQLGTSLSKFSVGERIGFIVDKNGTLKSVWQLKTKKK